MVLAQSVVLPGFATLFAALVWGIAILGVFVPSAIVPKTTYQDIGSNAMMASAGVVNAAIFLPSTVLGAAMTVGRSLTDAGKFEAIFFLAVGLQDLSCSTSLTGR